MEDVDSAADENRFRTAASLLDLLSAPLLTQFRREVRIRYQSKNPRLLCGNCRKPVYVSLSGTRIKEDRDGRDAFFAHHAGTAEECEWGTGGKNPRDVDSLKYSGAGEGEQHSRLKLMLARMLEADPAFSEVQTEEVISREGGWRKPDVMANFLDGIVAFDLQLATTQLPAIVGREEFYRRHGIRYVWVTRTDDPRSLARQAFQDIYWNNEAQIFGIDERAEVASLKKRRLHLWILVVVPRFDTRGLRSVWERRLIGRDEIDWNTPSGRPRYPDTDFTSAVRNLIEIRFADARRRLIMAVKRSENDSSRHSEYEAYVNAGHAWDEIACAVGAPSWADADQDQIFKAIGVLATAAAGRKMDYSGYENLTLVVNNLLEPATCRGWTNALVSVAEAHGHADMLNRNSTQRKIKRNLEEEHPDLSRKYAPMLDILFPESAFSRVSGSPAEIEEV